MNQVIENAYLNYLSPELALPRCSALLFAGSAFYIGFLDPIVRSNYDNPRTNLYHWAGVAKVSQIAMNVLAGVTGLLGLNAYRITQEPLWAWGSLAILAAIPFSLFGLRPLEKHLHDEHRVASTNLESSRCDGILNKIGSWVWRHRIETVLAVTSAVLFYLA